MLNRTTFTHNQNIHYDLLVNVIPTVKKCYHCKVIQNLTGTKLMTLQREYDKLQHYLQIREDKGLFQCQSCGEDNADRNADYNIEKRGLGQASNQGSTVDMPRTFPSVDRNTMMRKEASVFKLRYFTMLQICQLFSSVCQQGPPFGRLFVLLDFFVLS